jgi:hypothetical protein
MSATPGWNFQRSAGIISDQTLLLHCGCYKELATGPIFMGNALVEDKKRTSELPYCEITISKMVDEWNARALVLPPPLQQQATTNFSVPESLPPIYVIMHYFQQIL